MLLLKVYWATQRFKQIDVGVQPSTARFSFYLLSAGFYSQLFRLFLLVKSSRHLENNKLTGHLPLYLGNLQTLHELYVKISLIVHPL